MIPLIPIALGGLGVYKLINAYNLSVEAGKISSEAERLFQIEQENFRAECQNLSNILNDFGLFKKRIIETECKQLVAILNNRENSNQQQVELEYNDIFYSFEKSINNINSIQYSLSYSHDTTEEIAIGICKGVGTSSAIKVITSDLGIQFALENLITNSLALPVGLLIAGLSAESKAEKRLTEAKSNEALIEITISEMKNQLEIFKIVYNRVAELKMVIERLQKAYNRQFNRFINEKDKMDLFDKRCLEKYNSFSQLVILGKGLKELLDLPVFEENFLPTSDKIIKIEIEKAEALISF